MTSPNHTDIALPSIPLRSTKASWATRKSSQTTLSTQEEKEPPKRDRLILFVIGGITYSEIRVVEELANQFGREVILGASTSTKE